MVLLGLMAVDYTSKRLQETKAKTSVEGFELPASSKTLQGMDGFNDGLVFVLYVFAVSLLLLEIMLLFYAVTIALRCSKPGMNRVAHVALALFFTVPYVLLALFLSPCVEKL